jgi:hypothetical protein
MMREILNLMRGHFKKKMVALLCDVLHPSNFSFSGQPSKLVAFACDCWLLYIGFITDNLKKYKLIMTNFMFG